MKGSLDQPPVIIYVSTWKMILGLLGSVMFVAIAVVLNKIGRGGVLMDLCGLFFAAVGLRYLLVLIFRSRFEISPTGILWFKGYRTFKYRWSDIFNFRAIRVSSFTHAVAFDIKPESSAAPKFRALNRAISGADNTLGIGWTISPEALADLLNAARARWEVF
jgi:hypothetical protein